MTDDTASRRYTFKLYPTAEQADEMTRQCHMCGDLWNALLQRQEDTWRRWQGGTELARKRLTFFDMTAEITQLRRECPEWAALSVWTPHRVAKALDDAFKAFFRRAKQGSGAASGYPRFRPRRLQTWLPHRGVSGFRMAPEYREGRSRQLHWQVYFKGVPGTVRAMGRFPAEPLSITHVDVRFEAGAWWLSVCAEMPARHRRNGRLPAKIHFNLIDCFAALNGQDVPGWLIGLDFENDANRIADLQRLIAAETKGSERSRDLKARKARIEARVARRRREALHVWTTAVVARASAITVIRPTSFQDETRSGRGDARQWGAAVRTKAEVNRQALGMAPGSACQMLAYKAAEAGIAYIEEVAETPVAVGNLLVETARQARRARRAASQERTAA